jgi:hypothetical protein
VVAGGVCKYGGVGFREPSEEFCGLGSPGELTNSPSSPEAIRFVKCNGDLNCSGEGL